MSGDRGTSPCNKFEANIFNKSKCQNCFKSRELHSQINQELQQVKPVYGGWLCLAPEGTDFDKPMHRSRKWQRRFFVLYEDGSLSFALDDQSSTLPQGTMNLNLSCDISDAELRTGQKNALSIATPQQEVFIRGDSREIINGWSDQLSVYLQSNNNHQRKRRVKPVSGQHHEVSPVKMADTGTTESRISQEDSRSPPTDDWSTCPSLRDPVDSEKPETHRSRTRRLGSSTERTLGLNLSEEKQEGGRALRKSRSETRSNRREKLQSSGDVDQLSPPPPQRRTRSLDRRTSDCIITQDSLNFKKGWMVKLDENDQYKKFWFVLSTDRLRFYRDSMAEEASKVEGEIDLRKCFKVSEFKVQRNYGFQIHTPQRVFTLAAMTAGIRKNWIQALTRNVCPAEESDISSTEHLLQPGLPMDSPSAQREAQKKHVSVTQRRREGRYRTYDWAEFKTQRKLSQDQESKPNQDQQRGPNQDQESKLNQDQQRSEDLSSQEVGEPERWRRRKERRRRFEDMIGFSLNGDHSADKSKRSSSAESLQRQEKEEVEACWKRVEKSFFRLEKCIPVLNEGRDSEREELIDQYRTTVEDLKTRLEESEQLREKLEDQLRAKSKQVEADFFQLDPDKNRIPQKQNFTTYEPPVTSQIPRICLQDSDGNLMDLLQDTTPALSLVKTNLQDEVHASCEWVTSQETNRQLHDQPADFCVESPLPAEKEMITRLTKEVQLLLSHNEILNQKNKEILNQLTEASNEIEHLKAELSRRFTETKQLPNKEEQGGSRQELNQTNQQLQEAQRLIASLQGRLNEVKELQFYNEKRKDENEEKWEVTLVEIKTESDQSDLANEELQRLNPELKDVQKHQHPFAAEMKPEILSQRHRNGKRGKVLVFGEDKMILKLMEGMMNRLRSLLKLDLLCLSKEEEPMWMSQLRREDNFWSSRLHHEKPEEEVREEMIVEMQMLLLGLGLITRTDLCLREGRDSLTDLDLICMPDHTRIFGLGKKYETEQFQVFTQMNFSLLNLLSFLMSSSISSSKLDRLPLTETRPSGLSYPSWFGFFLSAASEALVCSLPSKYERNLLFSSSLCTNYVELMEENQELIPIMFDREEEERSQTGRAHSQDTEEEMVHTAKEELRMTHTNLSYEMEEVLLLRQRVEELEEQLSIMEEMREVFDVKLSSVQMQHQREMEKLKVTCRRGLTCMEESQLKLLEELQRQHQQEVERLLVERDRLLEEESAATATAIEAIKNAYRVELQREEQRRRQSESSSGSSHLEDVYRRHREELASCHRELHVLSQQLSLRCLEVGHLVQALEAERKTLCVCQRENQHLRTRNQELSTHLAAEITRLCSQVKLDDLALGQRADTYEMEIMLRVKESEVQGLRQEITSLTDDLQAAQREQRNATKKYKEVITDLRIMRVKTERETEELRENLRLAHCALDQTNGMTSL